MIHIMVLFLQLQRELLLLIIYMKEYQEFLVCGKMDVIEAISELTFLKHYHRRNRSQSPLYRFTFLM